MSLTLENKVAQSDLNNLFSLISLISLISLYFQKTIEFQFKILQDILRKENQVDFGFQIWI